MPRVIVTGGSGKLGRAVLRDLVEHDYDVLNLDQAPLADPICPTVRVDLANFGDVSNVILGGLDERTRLVRCGRPSRGDSGTRAIRQPADLRQQRARDLQRFRGVPDGRHPEHRVRLERDRAGPPFDTPPPYVPVDEEYAPRPETTYSLGKLVDETIARQYVRWDPTLKIVGLRFSNVMDVEDYAAFPGFDAEATKRKWNLWCYIDARDGAQAVRKALEATFTGFEAFIIANADTVMRRPNRELLAEVFPTVEVRPGVTANGTLFSIEKAKRLLGYQPEHSWRDHT